MSKQLFKGQTNHRMSEEELQEFCKISRIVHDSGEDHQKQDEIFNMLFFQAKRNLLFWSKKLLI